MIYPTWFGPPAKPLFGMLHVPERKEARGGVVICPPLGREHVTTYRGVKQLAERLCASGLVVLRFDYAGTGDSFGDQQTPNAAAEWISNIGMALDYLHCSGVQEVALAGLRAGALLAALASREHSNLRGLALWDPVRQGRQYVREQRATQRLVSQGSTAETDVECTELLGCILHNSTLAQLNDMDLAAALDGIEIPVLMALRAPSTPDEWPSSEAENRNLSHLLLEDHESFVSPSSFIFQVPTAAIASLANAIQAWFGTEFSAINPALRTEAIYQTAPGIMIRETLAFHSKGLFSICNAPLETNANTNSVVFHGTATEHRIGPVRLWTESARQLATQGIRSYRFDLQGVGDSGSVSNNESTPSYTQRARQDSITFVQSIAIPPSHLIMTGVCSGAWHSAYVARKIGARAVILVSLADWSIEQRPKIRRAHIDAMQSPVATRLFELARVIRNGIRKVQKHIPYSAWLLLGKCGLVQAPELLLQQLWRKQIATTVMLTPDDEQWFIAHRGPDGLHRLRKEHYPGTIIVQTEGDHSLYGCKIRKLAHQLVMEKVAESFHNAAS